MRKAFINIIYMQLHTWTFLTSWFQNHDANNMQDCQVNDNVSCSHTFSFYFVNTIAKVKAFLIQTNKMIVFFEEKYHLSEKRAFLLHIITWHSASGNITTAWKRSHDYKYFSKRAVPESVTRTCNAWNTNVSRAEHERDAGVTRTCYGFFDKEFVRI